MVSFTLVSFICSSTCLCCGCLAPCLRFPGAVGVFLSSSFLAWSARDWALLLWLTHWCPSFIWHRRPQPWALLAESTPSLWPQPCCLAIRKSLCSHFRSPSGSSTLWGYLRLLRS